ncbi:WD40-repeat-containing domain protein [Glomus cerebriforme]|uniref:WD40-repeat-containing domain protein n=1 Tax=Glomus cerebriforme TaxID=658196 RepID=A0A397TKF8_9GLOM|nr:WD40-repeat-containing domain protein [Glomus cerebriforme]
MSRTLTKFSVKVDFPVYCTVFTPSGEILLGGGGGTGNTGVKNKLVLFEPKLSEKSLEKLTETILSGEEDRPTCIALHTKENIFSCNINSSEEKIKIGENNNCRIFQYSNEKIELIRTVQTITSTNEDDYQRVNAFSQNGKLLATGGTDSKLTVLKYPSLNIAFPPLNFNKQEIYDLDFDSTGNQLLVVSANTLKILSTKKGESIHTIEKPVFRKNSRCQFRACRFGKGITAGYFYTVVNMTSESRTFIVKWNAVTFERVSTKAIGKKRITAFAISDNGKLLGFGTSDHGIGICDSKSLKVLLFVSKVHGFPPTTIAFSHDSTTVVSGSADNSVHIIQLPEKFDSGGFRLFLILIGTLIAFYAIFYQFYLID